MTSMKDLRMQLKKSYDEYQKQEKKFEIVKKKVEDEVKRKFDVMDTDKNGSISLNEYLIALVAYDETLSLDKLN